MEPAIYFTFGGDIFLRGDDENVLLEIRFKGEFSKFSLKEKVEGLRQLMPTIEDLITEED